MLTRFLSPLAFFIFLFSTAELFSQQKSALVIEGIQTKTSLEVYLNQIADKSELRFYFDKNLLKDFYLDNADNGKLLFDFFNVDLLSKGVVCMVYRQNNIVLIDKSKLQFNAKSKPGGSEGSGYTTITDIGDPMLAGKFKKAMVTGFITSGETGEPLPGAMLVVSDKNMGTVTDGNGHFTIELPIGRNEIKVAFVGFEDKDLLVNVISPGKFGIELFENTVALDQVIITSSGNANVKSAEMSIIRLDAKTINSLPVLMGEPDLMKTMTLLPGIQSSGDLASGFNVRGGNSDQNLILIDDVPIYNSNHLFGMFSILDSRMIENLEMYKGGAPASFGGRASSVMDVNLTEGNYKEWEGSGGIGLYNSKLMVKGPIKKDKASIVIGGRTTYSDWMLKKIPDVDIRNSAANFYDFTAKITYKVNDNNRLSAFGYYSHDKFDYAGKAILEYNNKLASVKWNHITGKNLTYSVSAFISQYETQTVDKENNFSATSINTGIQQEGLRIRTLYSTNSRNTLEFGMEANHYTLIPGIQKPYTVESEVGNKELDKQFSADAAVYVQDKFDITDHLSISAGLRFSYYMLLGPGSVNQYTAGEFISETSYLGKKSYGNKEIIQTYNGLEPRINIKYGFENNSAVKAGFSRSMQYMHVVSNSTVITPTDFWKSSDPYIKPATSDQLVAGYFRNLSNGRFETSFEVYYKRIKNVIDYKNGAQLIMNEFLEQDLLGGDLDAYGAELLIRKNSGRMTGWISYTYSRSYMQTHGAITAELVNEGEIYSSNYDKPNDLSVVMNYRISRRFTFGSSFTYSTGRAITFPEGKAQFYYNNLAIFSPRNKYRQRDYNRLDLSLTWDISLKRDKRFYSSWTLAIYNAYGRKNPYSSYYKKDIPTEKNNYNTYAFYELSIIGIPIPSLTYNLRF